MRKSIPIFLTMALLLAGTAGAHAETAGSGYTDMKATHWAYSAVSAMSEKEIVKGYPDGSFKPGGTVTYGEFIKMTLIADTGRDVGNAAGKVWASNYYNTAVEEGYFTIYDIHTSQLSNPIPRGDMALLISSALGEMEIKDYDKIAKGIFDVNAETKHDHDIVKSYGAGILTGYAGNTFRPEGTLTRAEAATVIQRLTDESKRVMPKTGEPQAAGTDIGAVIENYKTFEQASIDAGYGSTLAQATKYEYVEDMSKYKVTLGEKNGTKWIDINGAPPLKLGWGNLYLMKDNEIVKLTNDGIYDGSRHPEHIDITTIEYFVFSWYNGAEDTLGIMANPLYQGQ